MSSDQTPQPPARRDRREAVREKAVAVQAKQRRSRVVRTGIAAALVGGLVVAGGVAVAWTVASDNSRKDLTPSGMNDDAIVIDTIPPSVMASFSGSGTQSATEGTTQMGVESPAPESTPEPTATQERLAVDIYVDYLSEASADFQLANARQLSEWVSEGAATISYHPVALLTSKSNGTKYSLRAAAAAACVATYSPESFFSFNHELLVSQPEIDTDGHSDAELADLAQAVGSENVKVVRGCIEGGDFTSWVQQATARALAEPLGETKAPLSGPAVLVNGSAYAGDVSDQKEFAQFVLTLASDAYYSTPTPTPTPGATTTPSPAPAQ